MYTRTYTETGMNARFTEIKWKYKAQIGINKKSYFRDHFEKVYRTKKKKKKRAQIHPMTAKQGNLHYFLHANLVFAENIDKLRQSQGTKFFSE